MNPKEYMPHVALNELRDEGIVAYFEKKSFERKQYNAIGWVGEDNPVTAAVGSTLYQDPSKSVPFGIQNDILRQGKVREVVLICKHWKHYFRIPVSAFQQFTMTQDDGRLLFQVNLSSQLRSLDTPTPIDLSPYYKRRDSQP